jgi:hypothetical protein
VDPDQGRLKMTFIIAIVGIGSVLLALLICVIAFRNVQQPGQVIPAVVGAVTTAIGTLAGLVAGHTAGAAGKENAEQRAQSNERDAAAGRALATAIKSDNAEAADGLEGVPAPEGADAVLRKHDEMAKALFP